MNVVIANTYKELMDQLGLEVIKKIDGKFKVDEILDNLINLYYNKMIIDITAINNYTNIEVLKDLASKIDPSRILFLLDDESKNNTPEFFAKLVECGFYNFTRNIEGLKYLYNSPNKYEDVAHYLQSNDAVKPSVPEETVEKTEVKFYQHSERRIIGIINLTNHAGASSLTNMMVRQLNTNGYNAIGIEMFKQDLLYYHSDALFSCMNKLDLDNTLKKHSEANVVIIDLNEFGEYQEYCDDVLCLVEPSFIRLTKLLKKNPNVFSQYKNDLIVLNMSFVTSSEVADFEYEAKVKVFANIPPLNDRNKNLIEVNRLLNKLGYNIN